MQYDDVKACAEQLSGQLADPQRGTICPQCLAEFAYVLGDNDASHLPRLRQDCHQLFDRCILLFLAPRTPDEAIRLQRAAVMCDRHRSHDRADRSSARRLGLILDAVELILSLGLYAGKHSALARALNTLKSFASRSGRWPARLEQLLPFGAEQAVARLIELAELRVAGGPLNMLTHCLLMARAAVLPVVLADADRPRLVTVLSKTLAMDAKTCAWKDDPRAVVGGFFAAVLSGPGALSRDFDMLVAGAETELYRGVRDAVSSAPDALRGLDVLLDVCVTRLYWKLGARAGAVPRLPPRAAEYSRSLKRETTRDRAYARLVHAVVRQAGLAQQCAARGCAAAALRDGDGAKFQICGRCRVLRYCSKACQARAWRGDSPPHKAVCAVLCRFDAHKYVQSPHGSFDEQYARVLPQLSDDEAVVFNAWLTACRDEFGTLSELLIGPPVDVRGPDHTGTKNFTYLVLALVFATIFAFSFLPFAWAISVTLLAIGLVGSLLVLPCIPFLILWYRGAV